MENVPAPILSMVLGYLGLKEMESVARASSTLFRAVLQDTVYHRRIHRFLERFERQVEYFRRSHPYCFVSTEVKTAVERKFQRLQEYYASFTRNAEGVQTLSERLLLFRE